MSNVSTNLFKNGLKIIIDNAPCSIIENIIVKPGKGQAFNRVKLRNLLTGRVIERTFKSGESVPTADVLETEMTYLYSDGEFWHFMDPNSFEQHQMNKDVMADAAQWLTEEDQCQVTLYNGAAISVTAPTFVSLKIVETDPGLRGDTASGGSKPAKLETGATVRVPLFVNQDEVIKVDTRTAEYVSRVKS